MTNPLLITLLVISLSGCHFQKGSEYTMTDPQVDHSPEFPGGEAELKRFITENLHYPITAQKAGIAGKVFVSFTIKADGMIQDTKLMKGLDPEFDEEALRVVKQMPRWKPGRQDGKPIDINYTIPVEFALARVANK